MSKIPIVVKPTTGGDKFTVEVDLDISVLELKEEVSKQSSIPAAEQRLIYKGQVLKDDRVLRTYGRSTLCPYFPFYFCPLVHNLTLDLCIGLESEHVVHLVRGRPQGGSTG